MNPTFKFGIFLFASLLITVLGYQFITEQGLFDHNIHLVISTDENISGIKIDSPVEYLGVPVGKVKDLGLSGNQVYLTLAIHKETTIPVHSSFIVCPAGFMGSQIIKIEPSDESQWYHDQDTIATPLVRQAPDTNLVKTLVPILQGLSKSVGEALIDFANDSLIIDTLGTKNQLRNE